MGELKNKKYWLGYVVSGGLGRHFEKEIYSHFESIEEIFNAPRSAFYGFEEFIVPKTLDKFFDNKAKVDIDKEFEKIESKGIKILTIEDEKYPDILRQIYDPPVVLFYKGNINCLSGEKIVSVVGSRKASSYAVEMTKKIVDGLRGTDIVVVSGMAAGIDSAAHRGALNAKLNTIGVMGAGFDYLYPKTNIALYDEVLEKDGLIITEYLPSDPPDSWRFPQRNRIITGLSQGLLLAEAAEKSGALISAHLALEQNKEIMCIPGMATNPNTYGPHKMIKNGAMLVETAEDLIFSMRWNISLEKGEQKTFLLNLSEEEIKVLDVLEIEPKTIDNIVSETKIEIAHLMVILTKMELEAIIKQAQDGRYMRI